MANDQPSPLAGFHQAKSERRYLIVRIMDGEKLYLTGFGEYTPDKCCAISLPRESVERHVLAGASSELA